MGNTVVKCCVAGEGVVRVMTAGGQVEEFERPISAGQVTERHPGYLLLDATSLEGRDNKQTGQVVPDEVTFVASDVALQAGRLYVLCTAPRTAPGPEPQPHRAVPPDSRTVPSQPDGTRTVPSYELDLGRFPTRSGSASVSSKGSFEKSCAFPARDSIDLFEQFTPTCKRRRSSVVIASDILHSFQVKEEAAVDVPVVPEPKEEKVKGHGWSPSLSSIPESPATSLRALELPPAAAQICHTPPRHSTNINELLKQAILHKHPRSFWR